MRSRSFIGASFLMSRLARGLRLSRRRAVGFRLSTRSLVRAQPPSANRARAEAWTMPTGALAWLSTLPEPGEPSAAVLSANGRRYAAHPHADGRIVIHTQAGKVVLALYQSFTTCAAAPAAWRCSPRSAAPRRGELASRKERQGQYHLSGFILYDHHQGRIVVRALFSQLHDFALGIRKCRCNIRQVRTMRVILNPIRSAYCEEISRHPNAP
jgi:hypothetical protein